MMIVPRLTICLDFDDLSEIVGSSSGLDPGMCYQNGQTQTKARSCASLAVCVHVLVVNTAPHSAPCAVHVQVHQVHPHTMLSS